MFNERLCCLALLKTMMAFPSADYALTKYLIDSNRTISMDLRRIFFIGALLESCNFSSFWRIMNEENKDDTPTDELLMSKKPEDIREVRRLVDQISGFKDAVKKYACQVIHVTFQNISKQQLRRLLGGINDQTLMETANRYGWKVLDDDTVFIQNHEDKIKSRNIEEKLKLEDCLCLLKTVQPIQI